MAQKPVSKWTDALADAILGGRSEPVVQEHLDDLLVWLSNGDAPVVNRIEQAFTERQIERQEAEELALTLLDKVLFTASDSPYRILGLPPAANPEDSKIRYRRLILAFHPDRKQHLAEWLNERTERINAAYSQLKSGNYQEPKSNQPVRPQAGRNYSKPHPNKRGFQRQAPFTANPHSGRMRASFGNASKFERRFFGTLIVFCAVFLGYLFYSNMANKSPDQALASASKPAHSVAESLSTEPKIAPASDTEPVTPKHQKTATTSAGNHPTAEPTSPAESDPAAILKRTEALIAEIESRTKPPEPTTPPPRSEALSSLEDTLSAWQDSLQWKPPQSKQDPSLEKANPRHEPQIAAKKPDPATKPKKPPTQNKSKSKPKLTKKPKAAPRSSPAPTTAPIQTAKIKTKSTRANNCDGANRFIVSFARRYSSGNLDSFLRLYSNKAVENNKAGKGKIRSLYRSFFRSTSERNLSFNINRLKPSSSGSCAATGTYRVSYRNDKGERVSMAGKATFVLNREARSYRIKSLRYHDSRPLQSSSSSTQVRTPTPSVTNTCNGASGFISSFASSYSSGNVNTFLNFYSGGAVENGKAGKSNIRALYEPFFNTTSGRRLSFRINNIQANGNNACTASGSYQVSYRNANGQQVSKSGQVSFVLDRNANANSYRVKQLQYR